MSDIELVSQQSGGLTPPEVLLWQHSTGVSDLVAEVWWGHCTWCVAM